MRDISWKKNNLKNILDRKGVTQTELAEYLGIARNTLSQYVNAKREPNIEMICKMCTYLGIHNIEDLFK